MLIGQLLQAAGKRLSSLKDQAVSVRVVAPCYQQINKKGVLKPQLLQAACKLLGQRLCDLIDDHFNNINLFVCMDIILTLQQQLSYILYPLLLYKYKKQVN